MNTTSMAVATALLLGCSGTGLERNPVPEQPPPMVVDLAALGDGETAVSGYCGVIGSGGIRAILPLGGDGAFATAYGNGRVVIQEVGKPNALRTILAHNAPISDMAVSADAQLMVTAAENGEVKLWRLSDGQLVRIVRSNGITIRVALSPDGSRLAVQRAEPEELRTIVEVQLSIEGTPLWRAPNNNGGYNLAFSADGKTLLHGGDTFFVRTASDGQLLREVKPTGFGVSAFSRDFSRLMASRSRISTVALLDGTTGQPLWTIVHPGPGNHVIQAARFSPDESEIAFMLSDGTLNIVRASDGSLIRQWTITDGGGTAVAYSSGGTQLALGLAEGGFRVWDLASGELLVKETALPGHTTPATQVAFSPDGSLIGSMASTLGRDRSLKVWRTNDAALLYVKFPNPMDGTARAFAMAPDSATIALTTGSMIGQVHLLNAVDGSIMRTIENAGGSLVFSPDGKWLVGSFHMWRTADGQEQPGFSGAYVGHAPMFSHDGSLLASTSDGSHSPADMVAVWRVSDRQLLWRRAAERWGGASAAFSPDGRHLVVADGNPHPTHLGDTSDMVRIHVSDSGAIVRQWSVPGVRAVAYAPTGEVVTAGDEGVRVWRKSDGQLIAEAVGAFTAVAVAADGQRLVAAGRDGSLHLMCGLGRALR